MGGLTEPLLGVKKRRGYGGAATVVDVASSPLKPPMRRGGLSRAPPAAVVLSLCLGGVAIVALNAKPHRRSASSSAPLELATAMDDVEPTDCVQNSWIDNGDCASCYYMLPKICQERFTCPAGSYCAAGSYEAATQEEAAAYFASIWWPAEGGGISCVPVTDGKAAPDGGQYWGYACGCTPGFYCPVNIAVPKFCPAEYECETPAERRKCRNRRYCKQGTVDGWKCDWGQDCPKGTEAPSAGAAFLVWFVALTIIAYGFFVVRDKYRTKKLDKGNQELEDYCDLVKDHGELEKLKKAQTAAEHAKTLENVTNEDGYRIEFADLRLTLPNGVTVMRGPSGALEMGKTTAIMGASGAGKTTIMNLITGKVKKTGGWITCNGEPCDDLSKYRSRTAFVPQEDVMHRELTVLDNITFAANLRLPADWSPDQKRQKVMQTLFTLDLVHIQHSIIGDEFERGISGGQRKRVNVGLELVSDPKLLFLDEPTSGLDSVSATKLCGILRGIAEDHHLTIAAVVHSPGPVAFASFHNFLLLQTGGRLVYYGPMPEVESYFSDIGFPFPRGETLAPLADFLLQKVAGEGEPSKDAKYALHDGEDWDHMTGFTKLWHMKQGLPPPEEEPEPKHLTRLDIWKHTIKSMMTELPGQYANAFCPPAGDDDRATLGGFATFQLCFKRACQQNYTTFYSFFLSIIVMYVAIGFAMGALFTSGEDPPNVLGGYPPDICLQQYPELKSGCLDLQMNSYLNLMSPLVFIFVALSAATSASTFGCETAQYWRECSGGLNTPAYFFAKALADLPLCFCSALALWAPFDAIFVTPMGNGEFFFALLLLNIFGYASGYFISFLVPYRYCGLSAVAWSVWWGTLFSGTAMLIHDQPQLKFMYYSSAPRWFLEGYFDASTVYPYEKVRSGRLKGEDYFPAVGRAKDTYAYYNRFWPSMGYLTIVIVVLMAINLWVITTTRLDKKK